MDDATSAGHPVELALSPRPIRGAVFVPTLDGVPWQTIFRLAVRAQVGTWGGWGNLLLPLPEGNAADELLLWALLDIFDADTFQVQQVIVSDLRELAPNAHTATVEAHRRQLKSFDEQVVVAELERFESKSVTRPDLPEALQRLLVQRVSPLQYNDLLFSAHGPASDPPSQPFVAVEKLHPLPSQLPVMPVLADGDKALATAALHGELSPRLRQRLRARELEIVEGASRIAERGWSAALGERAPPVPWDLANVGLASYSRRGTAFPQIVVVIGDAPWDFALAYAALRLGAVARWVPSRVVDDGVALDALDAWLATARRGLPGPVLLTSTSASEVAAALGGMIETRAARGAPNLRWQHVKPLDLLPAHPSRLYERDRVGFPQTLTVHNGLTPALPTPVPRNVTVSSATEIAWMTDIGAPAWASLRNPGLGPALVRHAGSDHVVRSGRDGPAYMCPNIIVAAGVGLESQTVRPKLAPLALLEQVQAVFAAQGWRAEVSDKGIYVDQTAHLLGGHDELIAALRDHRARLLTAYLATGDSAPGWRLGDGRRYLTLDELLSLGQTDPDQTAADVARLEEAGVLTRGLVLRCGRCRAKEFYRLDVVGAGFRCGRCWLEQPLRPDSWMVGAEPPWRYGLAEVTYQFLCNDGDLPLLAAAAFMRAAQEPRPEAARRQQPLTCELDVYDLDGVKSELDIVAADGHELWVGEATHSRRLEKTNADEHERLQRLRRIAEILSARGALLVNHGCWDRGTVGRAEAAFDGIWPCLQALENQPMAPRWTPPAG